MSLLDIIYSFTGQRPKAPGKKDQLRKFRTTVEEMKWFEPNITMLPAEEDMAKLELPPTEEFVLFGFTSIKEIYGIVENKMRIYGMDSPKDFCCWRIMKPDRDDYIIALTKDGLKALERMGAKIKPVAAPQKH